MGKRPDPKIPALIQEIGAICESRPAIQVMEVCGTHTVSLFRSGVKSMLPESLHLISGPGCPVCVTAQGYIDGACELARRPDVIIATYGDMVRVPGKDGSLADFRGQGAVVQVVYSARDAVKLARQNPDKAVVFLAVGFETTAPTTAAVLLEAEASGLENFFVLPGHKLVVPAMMALLAGGDVPIDGFMCPGHVSVIIGAQAYAPVAREHGKPCVVTGFEPAQMLEGILAILKQIEAEKAEVENVYRVAVSDRGNPVAMQMVDRVFEPGDAVWRALGTIPGSGLILRGEYEKFNAARKYELDTETDYEAPGCRCGEVIQGKLSPPDCALFGKVCTPIKPVGPCMVSSEGACAAWYKYGRNVARS
ncbi:MAG: hydrogenase formation protein HypD [bacterium]